MKTKWRRVSIISGLGLISFVLGALFYHSTLEDAFISFRYAEHLAQGYGLGAWNPGETPVEGYTTMLWVLILGLGAKMGISVLTLSKALGWLSMIAIFLVIYNFKHFARDFLPQWNWGRIGVISAVLVSLYFPMAWYSVSGMEVCPYALLLLLFVGLSLKYGHLSNYSDLIAAVLLLLTRPEGVIIVGIVYLGLLLNTRGQISGFRIVLLKLSAIVLFLVAITIWRWFYFGYPLPNTYYAKAAGTWGHVGLGWVYLRDAFTKWGYWLPLLSVVYLGWRYFRHRNLPAIVISWIAAVFVYLLFILKTGGDNWYAFPYYRHLLHLFPFMAVIFAMVLVSLCKERIWPVIIAVVLALFFLNRKVVFDPDPIGAELREEGLISKMMDPSRLLRHDPPSEYIAWVRNTFPPTTRLAATLAGALPYYTDFNTLDMLGLSTPHIAHYGTFAPGAVDTKSDMDYVMSQRPDLIETTIDANLILNNRPRSRNEAWRGMMENRMIDNPIFKKEYLFIRNVPYTAFPRALFIKESFLRDLPTKSDLEVTPVMETSLYLITSQE